ncbi:MAG: ABC transporter permease [Rhizobiales bacterium]|nr:ABC transporter permease [Hyphomicrobiales bacterium]MBA69147.1 ABC transporter permease [Hyphomicrobiales bacterium]|tara:strand:+ start:734 stop:1648 length:915 start_codon:yes stop_codon:yes gene_type:complete
MTEFPIVRRRHPWRWVLSLLLLALAAALAWQVSRNEVFDFATVPKYMFDPRIMSGLVVTLYVTIGSMLIGLVLGVLLAVMRISDNPVLRAMAEAFIWFFRGTPVLVQLIFWFNIGIIFPSLAIGIPGGPMLFEISTNTLMTAAVTALLGLGLNEGAYMSEIVRAGIVSVDRGQREAALAIGLPPQRVLFRIVLPQALRVIIPPTGNQFISLLKTSSLVSVIAAGDLLTQATRIYNENFRILELLVVASIWYLLLTTLASIGQFYIERRFSRGFAIPKSEAGPSVLKQFFGRGEGKAVQQEGRPS